MCVVNKKKGEEGEEGGRDVTNILYRFRSSFRASGFTPTKFRSMRKIRLSPNTSTSCPKNFRRIELAVRSRGRGTKTTCVPRVIGAYEAIRSAGELKPSDLEGRNYPMMETRNTSNRVEDYGERMRLR